MTRLAGLVAAAALIMLAGCTGGEPTSSVAPSASGASVPTGAPSAPVTSAPPSAGPPSGTATGLVPGADCLTGTWRLVRFIGLGDQSTYGTGQGGDVTIAFDNGRYALVGQGREPIRVILAGQAADLTVDGTVNGTYAPDGAEMAFTIGEATGQGTLKAGNQTQTLPMDQVSRVIAPQGKATLACPSGVLLIALPAIRLELER